MLEINQSEFKKEVIEAGKVVVDFYSTECPPCEALLPKFTQMSELYGEDITFIKIFRQQNKELAQELGVKSSPTVLFFDQGKEVAERISGGIKKSQMMECLNAMISKERAIEIQGKIKLTTSSYEVVILGGGPGGLAAGIYLGQAKVKTALVDVNLPGGQVSTTHQVSNYPGFVEPQPGYMLSHHMSEQTKASGVEYKVAVDITKIDVVNKTILIDNSELIQAKKIIISTGASPRYLGIEGEKEYKGNGISYCATCDAKYFQDKEVVVIGGGNSAVEESEFISKFASKITLVHQFDKLQANKTAQEKLFNNPKISVKFEHEPRAFVKQGDKMVVKVENLKTEAIEEISSDGVFVFVGMKPNTDLFDDVFDKDQWGYIVTNEDMETSVAGVYAVGDVRSKKYRQITTAVADGTIASIAVGKALDE